MQIDSSGVSKKNNYNELWAFLEDFSSSDKSDAGSKAAGFAQQLGRFLTYFHLTALHKNFVVIGAANEALQSSLTLHFQQAAKIVATLLDCFSSSVRRSLNSGWDVVRKSMNYRNRRIYSSKNPTSPTMT